MIREWTDRKGRSIPIHEMHTQHLESAILRTRGWAKVRRERAMLVDELTRRVVLREVAREMPCYRSVDIEIPERRR